FEQGFEDEYLTKKRDLISKFAGIKKQIDFRRYQGKMYPSYMSITSKINWYDIETQELKFETELFQQLLINKVTPDATERIRPPANMRHYGLQLQARPYNKKFWDNYNVIKETPLDKDILNDREQRATLREQFEEY